MNKAFLIMLVSILIVLVPCLSVSGDDHWQPQEMNEIQNTGDGIAAPVWVFGTTLYFSCQLQGEGLDLALPMDNTHTIAGAQPALPLSSTQKGIEVTEDLDLFYIALTAPDEPTTGVPSGRVLRPEPDGHPGIHTVSLAPSGYANGHLLLLPLLNYPPGTTGQVAPIIEYNGGYIIPILSLPRGHLNNHLDDSNGWGISYDSLVSLDYDVEKQRQ